MGRSILGQLFSRHRKVSFFAWQVELTTRCPLRCRMCVRDSSKNWPDADMPFAEFTKLGAYFRNVENVVLEGWGESLLYKELIDAIRIVKGAGSRPGFVTSGWGLTRNYIADLIRGGVEFIGFSLAGATPKTHNAIRINSDLQSILKSIQDFHRIKADRKVDSPKLHIVYLMLKDNVSEVLPLLDLAKRIGIEQVVLINVAQVSNGWQDDQRVFSCGADNACEAILEEAEIKAGELNIALSRPFLTPGTMAVCGEDPLRNLYVSVDGQVAPCVYLLPPAPSPVRRIFCGSERSIEKVSFGNIFSEPLDSIWNSQGYVEFRQSLRTRKKRFEEIYSVAASVTLDRDHLKRPGGTELPEPPGQCRTCHRMLGI